VGPTLGTDRRGDVADARAPRARWPWLVALVLAIAWAAYAGFRLPNLWSVTLYNVTWSDGTARRALFGTLLAPVWSVGGNEYWIYAAVAFAILGALLAVIVLVAMRARWTAQRIVILAWLLAPTGAYLFHEVGYLDQLVYLLLFASMWLWTRTSPFVAVLPVLASVLVHELVLLTTWPILVWWAWRAGVTRRQAWALALPALAGAVLLALPPLSDDRAAGIVARLTASLPFPLREDAIALYARTQQESWALYSPAHELLVVLPFALVIALTMLFVWVVTRQVEAGEQRWAAGALPVVLAPFLIVFGGWDTSRWVFLAYSNAVIVGYLWLERRSTAIGPVATGAAVLPFLLLALVPLQYFDGYDPRPFTPAGIRQVVEEPNFLRLPDR
jgi:hypothetical protein